MFECNIFIYNFDAQEGDYTGELADRSFGRLEKAVKLLQLNNHIFHTNDRDSFFKSFQCPGCDVFFNRSNNTNRCLMTCTDRLRHLCAKNVHTLRVTLFQNLGDFKIPVSKDKKLFNNLAAFHFELILFPSNELKPTQTTISMGKKVQFVSILWKLVDELIFV